MPDLELEVSARDCALLLAIPLTRDDFVAAYLDPQRDFCRQFEVRDAQVAPHAIWALFFEEVAALVDRVARAVQRLGVTVIRGARLDDWSRALAAHRVVTLVAHWRFVPIVAEDIVDLAALLHHTSRRASEVSRAVDDALPPGAIDHASIARALDALCAPAARRYLASDRRGDPRDRGLSRAFLEHDLPGLRHAPAIELADRMHATSEVIAATPYGYEGVIDLTVCNSILLAELLKRACRPALVVCSEFRASLAFRMIRYQLLVERIHAQRARYTDAIQQLGSN
jgi:hypothetical protein